MHAQQAHGRPAPPCRAPLPRRCTSYVFLNQNLTFTHFTKKYSTVYRTEVVRLLLDDASQSQILVMNELTTISPKLTTKSDFSVLCLYYRGQSQTTYRHWHGRLLGMWNSCRGRAHPEQAWLISPPIIPPRRPARRRQPPHFISTPLQCSTISLSIASSNFQAS